LAADGSIFMRLHILGICGTFMGGVAALARELDHDVEGSDDHVYPPMSTQLETLGITLMHGYQAEHLRASPGHAAPDLIVVGNALSRGNPAVEYMLDAHLRYVSGPQWLGETVLAGRPVLAVAGTHGKTTTASLLAFLLERAGLAPGFLIGGVPDDYGIAARLGGGGGQSHFSGHLPNAHGHALRKSDSDPLCPYPFVVEADEYDTAFFDKRSKFVHYRPDIAILNNLEYDHADIFPDVAAIQRQFHHLVRTVPGHGRLVVNAEDARLAEVLAMGCWTPVETFGIDCGDWQAHLLAPDGSAFAVDRGGQHLGKVHWSLLGRHNVANALAALAAAAAAGGDLQVMLDALKDFRGAKRRMELLGAPRGVHVYDDFAHHPTAIATTLAGLRAKVGRQRILVALEPRSNSMRQGAHVKALGPALHDADEVIFLQRPDLPWDAHVIAAALDGRETTVADVDSLLATLSARVREGDHVVFMSNGGFEGAPRRFIALLGR
jgi:UDP-N-acetylmuramate: L-alanyl-gamma-D-glutamyl-meso-diaminopimelate ligase